MASIESTAVARIEHDSYFGTVTFKSVDCWETAVLLHAILYQKLENYIDCFQHRAQNRLHIQNERETNDPRKSGRLCDSQK